MRKTFILSDVYDLSVLHVLNVVQKNQPTCQAGWLIDLYMQNNII